MGFKSNKSIRVTGIPAGTPEELYQEFVESLLVAPEKNSILSSLAEHYYLKFKSGPNSFTASPRNSETTVSDSAQTQAAGPEDSTSCSQSLSDTVPQQQSQQQLDRAALLPAVGERRGTTFAIQNGRPVGTVSFESKESQAAALTRHKNGNHPEATIRWSEWFVSRDFQNVTVLYQHDQPDVDICFIHGLGGTAMDTWTAKNNIMWPRDLLPQLVAFKKSRIMTFGYDSDMTDRQTVMGLENWAENLLSDLDQLRTTDQEKKRPLLLVCHSLGGLIARKAMIQLPKTPDIRGIALENCGLVFLATPHSGSTSADWNSFLAATCHTVAGVRFEAIEILKSFSPNSVWDKKDFLTLKPLPPFRCFAEGARMKTKKMNHHIVTQGSATLDPRSEAMMIMGQDHSTICKYESNCGGLEKITGALKLVLDEIKRAGTALSTPVVGKDRMFGHPRFTAHAYPSKTGHWWEGDHTHEARYRLQHQLPFFGRAQDIEFLESSVPLHPERRHFTIIKGIGGVGKTELLLRYVQSQRDSRNVFFLSPRSPHISPDHILAEIAMSIGFDMLENPQLNQERWKNSSVPERVKIFLDWLGRDCNKGSLLVVDDIELFRHSGIQTILRYPAWNTIVSTRDSEFYGGNHKLTERRLETLSIEATIAILQTTLEEIAPGEGTTFTQRQLLSIAQSIYGHPLAARLSIPFILDRLSTYDDRAQAFVDLLRDSNLSNRQTFLDFKLDNTSLNESFQISVERLQNATPGDINGPLKLLQLLPYLHVNHTSIDDFFKHPKPWLKTRKADLPDVYILGVGDAVVSQWLSQLRQVSLYLRDSRASRAKTLGFHPFVMQHALLLVDDEKRRSIIKQVFCLLHELEIQGASRELLVRPHTLHCLTTCENLDITIDTLSLKENVLRWLGKFPLNEVRPDIGYLTPISDQDGFDGDDFGCRKAEFMRSEGC